MTEGLHEHPLLRGTDALPAITIAQDILWGNTAQKPPHPKQGDIYVDSEADITYVCYADGTWTDILAAATPVTLAADADTLLGLSGQTLSLDTQTANTVFAGPTSGGAADPTFRAMVAADVAGHTHATSVQGGIVYQYKIHKFTPQQGPADDIVAGETLDLSMTGPVAETVVAIYQHFTTVGTTMTVDLDYGSTMDLDSITWTQIDSNSHNTADTQSKAITSSFDQTSIPADRLIRMSIPSVSGSYKNGIIFLVTKFTPPTS